MTLDVEEHKYVSKFFLRLPTQRCIAHYGIQVESLVLSQLHTHSLVPGTIFALRRRSQVYESLREMLQVLPRKTKEPRRLLKIQLLPGRNVKNQDSRGSIRFDGHSSEELVLHNDL